jgi:hypothetical protein
MPYPSMQPISAHRQSVPRDALCFIQPSAARLPLSDDHGAVLTNHQLVTRQHSGQRAPAGSRLVGLRDMASSAGSLIGLQICSSKNGANATRILGIGSRTVAIAKAGPDVCSVFAFSSRIPRRSFARMRYPDSARDERSRPLLGRGRPDHKRTCSSLRLVWVLHRRGTPYLIRGRAPKQSRRGPLRQSRACDRSQARAASHGPRECLTHSANRPCT